MLRSCDEGLRSRGITSRSARWMEEMLKEESVQGLIFIYTVLRGVWQGTRNSETRRTFYESSQHRRRSSHSS